MNRSTLRVVGGAGPVPPADDAYAEAVFRGRNGLSRMKTANRIALDGYLELGRAAVQAAESGKYGEGTLAHFAHEVGSSLSMVHKAKRVAQAIADEIWTRVHNLRLTFTHFRVVVEAGFQGEDAVHWLSEASRRRWSSKVLAKKIMDATFIGVTDANGNRLAAKRITDRMKEDAVREFYGGPEARFQDAFAKARHLLSALSEFHRPDIRSLLEAAATGAPDLGDVARLAQQLRAAADDIDFVLAESSGSDQEHDADDEAADAEALQEATGSD